MELSENQDLFKLPLLSSPRHIRLISVINSTVLDQPVCVKFTETSLDEPVQYQTLSYTWGETFVDGSHLNQYVICKEQPLRVTSNLFDFLDRLQWHCQAFNCQRETRLPFWIDAVCINQDDPAERGHQVELMAEIYRKSRRLVIWLGDTNVFPQLAWGRLSHQRHGWIGSLPSDFKTVKTSDIERAFDLPWFRRRGHSGTSELQCY